MSSRHLLNSEGHVVCGASPLPDGSNVTSDRTTVACRDCATRAPANMVVTDCCGRLLPESQTLVNDVHFSELCPACQSLDGSEHESHRSCDYTQTECPGADWSYVDGRVVKA